MPKRNYVALELKVIRIFTKEKTFNYKGVQYDVVTVGKPRVQGSGGECKTDVYVLGKSGKDICELKISVKSRANNEFQGNKLTADVAELYFGANWASIIQVATQSIADKFNESKLIFISRHHPTNANSITLGWKLEITDKQRTLSAPIRLNSQEIKDFIYKGTTQSDEKKHAIINGEIIQNSGIADYIIYTSLNEIQTTADIIDQLEKIDTKEFSPTYLVFTANNYRTKERKCDGRRYLAVKVNWFAAEGKLNHTIVFDNPLSTTGKDSVPSLLATLATLGKNHPEDMNPTQDIANPKIVSI